jgi:hypothetical protein
MYIEQRTEMRILAEARRWIGGNHRQANELSDPERERRVAEYARQVAENGCIVAWMPSEVREVRRRPTTRFAYGDALGRHLAACAG